MFCLRKKSVALSPSRRQPQRASEEARRHHNYKIHLASQPACSCVSNPRSLRRSSAAANATDGSELQNLVEIV